ncbi:hypothetical protein [Sedimenticola selenatireducens]|uniref:Uncharacterized protein n=1 Tax=Sedimenticola selenatireducens TaxID=191960 RepID=A0A557SI01_9GAMM|nr:hypothetical protein [Sedimenticola selenatireducens]TVO76980.1 hypothetical protein FHP88_06035 [Sedimenticola selenatireducens]TVT64423.1 MAG: hypothetical protein FHK78_09280 [Sedimenticola selenatireducens]
MNSRPIKGLDSPAYSQLGYCAWIKGSTLDFTQVRLSRELRHSLNSLAVLFIDHYPNSFNGKYKGKAFSIAMP